MKNSVHLMIAFLLSFILLFVSGCRENEQRDPQLNFPETVIDVSAEGGIVEVGYTLSNPVPGEDLYAEDDEDWIVSYDYSKDGMLGIVVEENTGEDSRNGFVTVFYASQQVRLLVRQSGSSAEEQGAIALEFDEETDVTGSSVKVTFRPEDPEMTYFGMVITLNDYKGYCQSSDEELFTLVLDQYKGYAEQLNISLEEFLSTRILMTGEQTHEITGLSLNTEYYVFAAGLTPQGEQTTDICKALFKTKDVERVDMDFDIDYRLDGVDLYAEITPSSDHRYFVDRVSRDVLENSGLTTEEHFQNALNATYNFTQQLLGMSLDEVLYTICETGPSSKSFTGTSALTYNAEWILCAFAISDEGVINSDIKEEIIKTGAPEPSDNILTIDVDEVSLDRVSFTVHTENDDPWTYAVVPADSYSGMSDDDILASMAGNSSYSVKTGEQSIKVKSLLSEEDYIIFAFGYDHGVINSGLFKSEVFTTLGSADVSGLEFEFAMAELSPLAARMTIKGDPASCLYYPFLVPADFTEEDALDYMEELGNSQVEQGISPLNYYKSIGERGTVTVSYQIYNYDEFKIAAVGIDERTGRLGPVGMSSVYEVPDLTYTDAFSISLSHDLYFDGIQVFKEFGGSYMGASGKAVIPMYVEFSGNETPLRWGVSVSDGNLMSESNERVLYLIENFETVYNKKRVDFALDWDREYTLLAVAWDGDGNISQIYRELFTVSRENVSPIDKFEPISDVILYSE